MNLSKSDFNRARDYINRYARELDQRRFDYHFEHSSMDGVLSALARYQNEDGGFGHGIEPDLRARDSSPIGTAHGFQVLREVDAPTTHEMVKAGIAYFLRSYDEKLACWHRLVPSFNDYPHESHWHYDPALTTKEAEFQWAWPSAEIVGYLHSYAALVPALFLDGVTRKAVAYVEALPEIWRDTPPWDEWNDTMTWLSIQVMCVSLPEPHRMRVLTKAARGAKHTIPPESASWRDSWEVPLNYVQSPDDPFADTLHEDVMRNLDLEIETQRDDGSFAPTWTKGHAHETEWNGYYTLRTLKALKAFGRLA
jgi:hypothetical protein